MTMFAVRGDDLRLGKVIENNDDTITLRIAKKGDVDLDTAGDKYVILVFVRKTSEGYAEVYTPWPTL